METRAKISKKITKLEKNIYKLIDLLEEYNRELTGDDPVDLSVQKTWLYKWGVGRAKEMTYEAMEKIESAKVNKDFSD